MAESWSPGDAPAVVADAAVRRVVSRAPTTPAAPQKPPDMGLQRPMGGKKDERMWSEAGDFVWDEFDRTLTLFTRLDGPYKGKALRVTYKDGPIAALEAMKPEDRFVKPVGGSGLEVLSKNRAEALEWMRTAQGEFQETEDQRKTRVGNRTSGPTLCNSATGSFLGVLTQLAGGTGYTKYLGQFDAMSIASKSNRAGAFHTIYSHPEGPKAGDVISYGKIEGITKEEAMNGVLRKASFADISHIGIFKSARPGTGGTGTIWTVVDGGQGTFASRQETRERTRTLTRERLIVKMPKLSETGKARGHLTEEMECAVLKSALADAGQSADDKLLRGWIDLDEFLGSADVEATNPDVSQASELGANHPVFVGKRLAPATP